MNRVFLGITGTLVIVVAVAASIHYLFTISDPAQRWPGHGHALSCVEGSEIAGSYLRGDATASIVLSGDGRFVLRKYTSVGAGGGSGYSCFYDPRSNPMIFEGITEGAWSVSEGMIELVCESSGMSFDRNRPKDDSRVFARPISWYGKKAITLEEFEQYTGIYVETERVPMCAGEAKTRLLN